jgi:hypothetical protein
VKIVKQIKALVSQFPSNAGREFLSAAQGIKYAKQGIKYAQPGVIATAARKTKPESEPMPPSR